MGAIKEAVIVLFVLPIIFQSVSGASVGVSPGIYAIDFEPGLRQDFWFNFHADDPELIIDLSIEGDLAEYVQLDKDKIVGVGDVFATLNLPNNIEIPGTHMIYIAAKQRPANKEGFALAVEMRGTIKVHVPYPGKYAEIEFEAENANAGEAVNFYLRIDSKGIEPITTVSTIVIFDSENKSVEILELGLDSILSGDFVEKEFQLDTIGYGAGNYRAVARVKHGGGEQTKEQNFRLGELKVDIIDYQKEVERDKINAFVVEIESFWNSQLENVYVTGKVAKYPINFQTPSVSISPFGKTTAIGHFDTTLIEEDEFLMKLTVHYQDKTNEKDVVVKFKKEINYLLIGLIAAITLLTVFLLWTVLKIRRLKKDGRKRRK